MKLMSDKSPELDDLHPRDLSKVAAMRVGSSGDVSQNSPNSEMVAADWKMAMSLF